MVAFCFLEVWCVPSTSNTYLKTARESKTNKSYDSQSPCCVDLTRSVFSCFCDLGVPYQPTMTTLHLIIIHPPQQLPGKDKSSTLCNYPDSVHFGFRTECIWKKSNLHNSTFPWTFWMILRGNALTFQGASPWIPRSFGFSFRTRGSVNLVGICKKNKVFERINKRSLIDLIEVSCPGVAHLSMPLQPFLPPPQATSRKA